MKLLVMGFGLALSLNAQAAMISWQESSALFALSSMSLFNILIALTAVSIWILFWQRAPRWLWTSLSAISLLLLSYGAKQAYAHYYLTEIGSAEGQMQLCQGQHTIINHHQKAIVFTRIDATGTQSCDADYFIPEGGRSLLDIESCRTGLVLRVNESCLLNL